MCRTYMCRTSERRINIILLDLGSSRKVLRSEQTKQKQRQGWGLSDAITSDTRERLALSIFDYTECTRRILLSDNTQLSSYLIILSYLRADNAGLYANTAFV
jgi:hypothetical protein